MASLPDELPDIGPRDARPALNPTVDLTSLTSARLTPAEAFVLSRVDGQTSYGALCALTGIGVDATLAVLRALRRARVILNPGEALLERLDDGSAVAANEIAAGPALDDTTKTRIVRVHRRVKALPSHELLGLPSAEGLDPAEVKRAYFAASKEVHPDRFYGDDLGSFRDKLADIFAELTRAFEACAKEAAKPKQVPPAGPK